MGFGVKPRKRSSLLARVGSGSDNAVMCVRGARLRSIKPAVNIAFMTDMRTKRS